MEGRARSIQWDEIREGIKDALYAEELNEKREIESRIL